MEVDDIRSNEQLLEYIKEHGKPKLVYFYGGYYSQWSRSPFTVDGEKYETAEHWMMVKKAETFNDHESRAKMSTTDNPSIVKKMGRRVKNFDPKKWEAVAFDYVVDGNVYKFDQNKNHMWELKQDVGSVLVEASPYDKIWGIGINEYNAPQFKVEDWQGTNLLGYAIMEARKQLLN